MNWLEKSSPESLLLGLTGDVMIGRLVNEQLDRSKPEYIWGNLLPILRKLDISMINLEAALTTSTEIVPKVFNFKANPKHVKALQEAFITLVNIGNNHILDFSETGLLDTVATLDKTNIFHVGAGSNLTEAKKPVVIHKNGISIGFLGCTDNEPDWNAGASRPGTFYVRVGDTKSLESEIALLRKKVDFVVLSIHWGPNMVERPSNKFRKFAHDLIDMGVDIFHGHSAHIFQGVEVYKEKLILYDTGDFVDDYYVDPYLRNDRSFLFMVEMTKNKLQKLKLLPTVIDNFQVNIAQDEEAKHIVELMQKLSQEFQTEITSFVSNNAMWGEIKI